MVRYTGDASGAVYAIMSQWGEGDAVSLASVQTSGASVITLLGDLQERHLSVQLLRGIDLGII